MATSTTTTMSSRIRCIQQCKDISGSKSLSDKSIELVRARVTAAQESAWAWVENMVEGVWSELTASAVPFLSSGSSIQKLDDVGFWRDEVWNILAPDMVRSVTEMLRGIRELMTVCECEVSAT